VEQRQNGGAGRLIVRRRDLIALLGGTALAWPLELRAQEPGRTYHIGVLCGLDCGDAPLIADLGRLGFVEGQNLQINEQFYEPGPEQRAQHAAELVKAKVDVILTSGAAPVRAAQQATATIPILVVTDDIVGEGLVQSLAHPGGNTTGISILATELDGKRQELLLELIPGARRIAALADSHNTLPTKVQALQDAARAQGVELVIHTVSTAEEIAPAIDAAKASGAAGLNVLASTLFFNPSKNFNRRIIFERTAALGLPAMYQWPLQAREGGLVAYGPSLDETRRQQLRLLVKLLRGTKPADLSVEQPTTFQLVVNLKTARALGLTIPKSFLARADELIE
jgi:putative tryptophan/tyrosine transport system substrate-binding protein